jgi:CHRD domain
MRLTSRVVLGLLALVALSAAAVLGFTGSAGGQGAATSDLFAQLNGKHEFDNQGMSGAGDPDAHGTFSATIKGNRLCFALTVTGLEKPVAAHIHEAAVGKNGPVVIPLKQPRAGDPGTSSGCVRSTTRELQEVQEKPQTYYANVHTGAFPNGAIRGQLFKATRRQNR